MRHGRFDKAITAIVLVAMPAVLAGCSASGGGSGSSTGNPTTGSAPTTVSAALAELPVTSWDSGSLEFGDVAQVGVLNGGADVSGPLTTYIGMGESPLAPYEQQDVGVLGFDPLKVTTAVTFGQLPHQTTVLYGSFNAVSIGKKLAAAGFKDKGTADGGALWAIGDNDQTTMTNPAGDPQLNVLDVSADRIVFGGSTIEVEALAASASTPLSTRAGLAAIANCLGSARSAVIGPASLASGAPMIGIGLLADTAADASEEVCVSAQSTTAATAIESHWIQQIQNGRSQAVDAAWSTLFVDPQATTVSNSPAVARLTAKPAAGAKVGTLLEAYYGPSTDFRSLITP